MPLAQATEGMTSPCEPTKGRNEPPIAEI